VVSSKEWVQKCRRDSSTTSLGSNDWWVLYRTPKERIINHLLASRTWLNRLLHMYRSHQDLLRKVCKVMAGLRLSIRRPLDIFLPRNYNGDKDTTNVIEKLLKSSYVQEGLDPRRQRTRPPLFFWIRSRTTNSLVDLPTSIIVNGHRLQSLPLSLVWLQALNWIRISC
jgi:hypothetical protein